MNIDDVLREMRSAALPGSHAHRWADAIESAMREPFITVAKGKSGSLLIRESDRAKLLVAGGTVDLYTLPPDAAAEIERLTEALEDAERVLTWGEPRPQPVLQRVRATLARKEETK